MKTDQAGIDFIKLHEGVELTAYADPIGLPTVGIGHLIRPQDSLKIGDRITESQAEAFLRSDLEAAEKAVTELVTVKLSQSQFNALVSFVFNLGRGRFAQSTLRRKLNTGDYEGAAAEFDRWVFAGGRKLPGLVKRRREERALFEQE